MVSQRTPHPTGFFFLFFELVQLERTGTHFIDGRHAGLVRRGSPVLPDAVEVLPLRALEQRSRILWPRVRADLVGPLRVERRRLYLIAEHLRHHGERAEDDLARDMHLGVGIFGRARQAVAYSSPLAIVLDGTHKNGEGTMNGEERNRSQI